MNIAEIAEIAEETQKLARTNGKLLMIQEVSNWLLNKPGIINKEDLVEFLLSKAEELEEELEDE